MEMKTNRRPGPQRRWSSGWPLRVIVVPVRGERARHVTLEEK